MSANNIQHKGFRFLFRALWYRNYRLFFFGHGTSLIGTWMTNIAISWLVYRLTRSPFLLGFVAFAGQIPSLILAPLAGVLIDRWNRRRVVLTAQFLAMTQSLTLAILAVTGVIQVWHIIVLRIFQGLVNAVDIPARQSFIVDMVEDKNDLGNAIALNSSMFNGARMIGPSVAGIIIALVGEWLCFLLDGLSYVAIIIALFSMRIKPRAANETTKPITQGLKEGFDYAFGFVPIRALILMVAMLSVFGFPYLVLMPIFAKDILGGGPNTMGFLMGAVGMGAVSGAIFMASRKSVVGLGRVMALSVMVFGVGIILFSLSRNLYLSLALLLFAGFGMMVQMASANTLLQTIIDDDKRGRVMSFYSMAFMGMAPFGSLLAGTLASKLGAPITNIIGGTVCLIGAAIFARNLPRLREMVRPIFIRLGIIPEVATGIQSTKRLPGK
ncbi:MAG: MFS transporter [candidate division Zixibacteria bacterium RBG_16_53_22]|nr:MAG: MFS transporter [candidate division Zixibacteria bacterium RBG_16_53_22]